MQIIEPKHGWPTFVCIGISLFHQAPNFPRLANHNNVSFFINLSVLAWCAFSVVQRKKPRFSGVILCHACMLLLIAIYFCAGFHKLNRDFFNPEYSCANWLHESIWVQALGVMENLPRPVEVASPWVAVKLELIAPLLLLFTATRNFTIAILVVFHAYLNLAGFSNFSSLAGVLLFGAAIYQKSLDYQKVLFSARVIASGSVLAVLFSRYSTSIVGVDSHLSQYIEGVGMNAGWLIGFFILLNAIRANRYIAVSRITCPRLTWLAPVLIVLWSSQPYLGLSNAGVLTMFSNLETRSSRCNHLLIDTRITKIFPFEEDVVSIISVAGGPHGYQDVSLAHADIPLVEFLFLSSQWAAMGDYPIRAELRYKGEHFSIDDLRDSRFGTSPWWSRFIHYRSLETGGAVRCRW